MTYKKKLIEVALPLEAINVASAREKSIRHGHPSTLHLWWARRPLAAARAVIFAQMVDDPSAHPDIFPTEKKQDKERQRLFRIIEDLVKWENTTNVAVLQQARDEIWQSWRYTCAENADHPRAKELFDRYKLPGFHDPFAGGGALPLEAQRLGLESYASDLNPVAVLINKAMIEIPPKFAGKPPVHPQFRHSGESRNPAAAAKLDPGLRRGGELFAKEWKGAQGLAEDVRYYGQWMRDEAEQRIGHLYPKIEVTAAMAEERPDLKQYVGQKLTVIAWLWARTVKSPNPAFADVDVPLASTFMLSTKAGKEAYVEPVIEGGSYRFMVKVGKPKDVEGVKNGTKLARGANFKCLMSGTPMTGDHIKGEGKAGRMGARLMAIVAEGDRGRVYLAPTLEMEAIALTAQPTWKPETRLPADMRSHWTPPYGLATYGDLFTPRQLVALTTFYDLVQEAMAKVKVDAQATWGAGVSPAYHQDGRNAHPPGWYRRGDKHPPHYDAAHLTQFVTFRLADTLPQEKLKEWKEDLAARRVTDAQYRQRAEDWLDQGMGACWLGDERIASVVQDALLHFDGTRYTLHGWVIMPNHVHVVFSPHEPHRLAEILHSWKSFTAKKANQILGRSGAFWQEDYFDRFMRDESDLNDTLTYLAYNPVVAGLSATPAQYPFAGGRASRPSDIGQCGGHDGRDARPPADDRPLDEGGAGATAYAEAVGVYLAFTVEKLAESHSSICTWSNSPKNELVVSTFRRQALPMTWDFGEANPFADSSGSLTKITEAVCKVLQISFPACAGGSSTQADAQSQQISAAKVVSTDPPYYDNIGYADLSDFFYVWMRRALKPVYPDLFATLAVPKAEELVATPYRHGSKEKAEIFFLDGMTQAMHRLAEQAHPAFPVTIYYAFKQAESDGGDGTTNTGWDTFLAAVIEAGFAISGTWPMRTERDARSISIGTNALASSIVLVCRPRPADAPTATRREFVAALKAELPQALAHLQAGNIAPVDLAQAAIGPGMAVYTRFARVLDADGQPIPVRAALALINQTLDEALAEQEGDFDADTRWALTWFDQVGFLDGDYGVAEQLSKSKNTSVSGLAEAGILVSKAGNVRLLKPAELPADWDPLQDARLTVWEMVHQLIRVLEAGGEGAAAALAAKLGSQAETARELCYRLYTLCERKKRAADAMAYNGLVQSWPEITRLAREAPQPVTPGTGDLYDAS